MTALKPCPFCGDLPTLFDNPCYFYQCVNVTCQGQEMSWNNTIEEALASWNTRPIEDALRARITELEKHIKNALDDIEATLKCLPYASYIDKVRILERIKYILTAEPQEEK